MRYKERRVRNGKKTQAAGRNLETEENVRVATKKHRQYGNFVGEE
jgi:hypothetical protein